MAKPECTCEPFIFAKDTPWQATIHHSECPTFCDCYYRAGGQLGRKGQIIHFEDCGWYEPPKPFKSGPVKGLRPRLMIVDEGL